MPIIYDLIYILASIFYLPILLMNGKVHSGFLSRLGIWPESQENSVKHKKNVWVHAVSVGEVVAVQKLIEQLKNAHQDCQVVLSVVTQTGYELAKSKIKDVFIIYAPLDFSFVVRKYILWIDPVLYIAVETEIWPNLFRALSNNHTDIIVVNGRISDKSFEKYRKVKFLIKRALKNVKAFLMQSDIDADRIMELGAAKEKVSVIGNMKFDDLPDKSELKLEDIGLTKNESILIAGSTHPGEEEVLLNVFSSISKEYPDLRLIIVPRHINRVKEISDLISDKGLAPVMFTQINHSRLRNNMVVVVDTIGQLRSLYSLAKIVFVGKSLTGWGGQNIIEPAFFSKPIIVGPNMQNFKDITDQFIKSRAIVQINSEGGLLSAVKRLLNDPGEMTRIGSSAKDVIKKCQGATDKSLKVISGCLNGVS